MNKLMLALSLLLMSSHVIADPGKYLATPEQSMLSEVIESWESKDKKVAAWQADVDFPVKNAEEFNQAAKTRDVILLRDAVRQAIDVANKISPEVQLFVCSAVDSKIAIVVRRVGQPECGKPI